MDMIKQIGSSINQSLRQLKDDAVRHKAIRDKNTIKADIADSKPYTIETHKAKALEISKEKFKTSDVNTVKANSAEDLKISSEIRRLKAWEDHVKQHERQHQLAGGDCAGAPSYTYTTGPDGKRYISGGEVTMYVPSGNSLEDSEVALERVKRAASAPADPSPQDLKTAAMASAKQASIRMNIAKKQAKEAYNESRHQELQLKELKGEHVDAIDKFKFKEVSAFELFI